MNTYKFIALAAIGISASSLHSIQGMQQSMQMPYLSPLIEKLHQYRYHVGGALTLAGLVYGAYKLWRSMQPCTINHHRKDFICSSTSHSFTHQPYKIGYTFSREPLSQHSPKHLYKININEISFKEKILTYQEKQKIFLTEKIPEKFMNHIKTQHSYDNQDNLISIAHNGNKILVSPVNMGKKRVCQYLGELLKAPTGESRIDFYEERL